jgi:hypothetical protein
MNGPEETPMPRPPFDPAAFVFGGLFIAIALIGLLDPTLARRIDLATFVPALLVVLGGVLLVTSARPGRRSGPRG